MTRKYSAFDDREAPAVKGKWFRIISRYGSLEEEGPWQYTANINKITLPRKDSRWEYYLEVRP